MFRELLLQEFAPYGALSDQQLSQLEQHYSLLARWNQKINLTRIRALDAAVRFHYCESLFLGASLPSGGLRIVDVGSGAGFPGIPVAIFRPQCTVDLVEVDQRKAVFLREASRELTNVRVIAGDSANVEPGYDWLVSRAVRAQEILSLAMASNVALLTSEGEEAKLPQPHTRVKIPWGAERIVVTFHVEHGNIVKRG